jgi:hypothetical protein
VEEAANLEIIEIKDDSVIKDERLVRTSGTGIILNPLSLQIKKYS